MAFFKVRVAGVAYELDKLTLGQARTLKRDFGLVDLEEFSGSDPDQLVGLMFLAMCEKRPTEDPKRILAEIEALDVDQFETVEDEAVDAPDPTPAPVAAGDGVPPVPSGTPETIPATPGDPSSPQS